MFIPEVGTKGVCGVPTPDLLNTSFMDGYSSISVSFNPVVSTVSICLQGRMSTTHSVSLTDFLVS